MSDRTARNAGREGRAPFDPRRILRPLRWLIFGAAIAFVVFGLPDFALFTMPPGPTPVFDLTAGDKVLVKTIADTSDLRTGDVVLHRDAAGVLHLGRLVALDGEALALDPARGTVARAEGGPSFPLPVGVAQRLPLRAGEALVLSENPDARDQGAIVPRQAIVARVIVRLPF